MTAPRQAHHDLRREHQRDQVLNVVVLRILAVGVATIGMWFFCVLHVDHNPPTQQLGAPDCAFAGIPFEGLQKTRVPEGFLGLQ